MKTAATTTILAPVVKVAPSSVVRESILSYRSAQSLSARPVPLLNSLVMLTAITRAVSPALAQCELSFIDRQSIDLAKANQQHHDYEKLLARLGARVVSLPAQSDLPDSMFVEDPALVLDELAIIFPLGTETRRREAPSVAEALTPYRRLQRVELPGTIEGGDILRVGKKLFVGRTARSNAEGIAQLARIVAPHGYQVIEVPVTSCLHLKSAVTSLGNNTLLANRAWFDSSFFAGYDWLDVDPAEGHAGNALVLAGTVIFPASFHRTRACIEARGFHVTSIDISELQKAESGLTCSSLIFETNGRS
jgi:dimethylargininase